jgi:hypothetical protein
MFLQKMLNEITPAIAFYRFWRSPPLNVLACYLKVEKIDMETNQS